ncbi:hypothetical protein BUALT_Bualt06G0121800 [Buddleja alternifolia]|uniref:Protein kinase domain-containing protein n=1 Tax=Buddleja alternifolia TaxID=168488 RepID=A0AAV6XLJ9_9LAMI|nr:hypothetical protein BUALT_Bualt06G0121800 [Buddleja alternifolia]
MDSGSLQGECEFQNELLLSLKIDCKYIVSVMGFSSDPRKHRMLLVYELMENGSLQDCLFHKKSVELRNWNKRFMIAPSNVLLDGGFDAKIGDLGLASFEVEDGSVAEAAAVVSPRMVAAMASPSDGIDKTSVSEGSFDRFSVESGGERSGWKKKKKSVSGKDWWWKQDNGVDGESGKVKDYVMEWIGSEIKKERPKSNWIGAPSSSVRKIEKKKKRRQLDDDKNVKKDKRRPAREWWKEEYCEELERKKKKKKKKKNLQGSMSDDCYSENWWQRDRRLDGFSGKLWKARKNSYDSVISSTPSMRGTVCYIAQEYGGGGDVSKKCDVYSFGVLLLVLIAGRRPLQVTGSPIIENLNKEQALLCITVALICLQKSPARRPSMKEVVGILCGDLASPQLPVEFSPSPPSRFPCKSKKIRLAQSSAQLLVYSVILANSLLCLNVINAFRHCNHYNSIDVRLELTVF